MTDVLQRLLKGELVDPDNGALLSVPTRSVVIERSLEGQEEALLRELELGDRLAVISDPTTYEVLGRRVEMAAESIGAVQSIVLPDKPKADSTIADEIRDSAAGADALIAVGSGTINDLCKLASAQVGKPYAVFATAPSMNGYTSVNAAITEKGHKKSLQAQGAAGVFIDLEVFASAPPRMIRSGLGDSLCRSTAQADWLLAGRLFGAAYRRAPFELLAEDEEHLFAEPEGLLRKDLGAMERLARTLCLSGFGMTICGGSYPASQGEHLIAHYIEMMADPSLPPAFHGEQIAVTTLTMARLQEAILKGSAPVLRPPNETLSEFEKRYGPTAGRSCWEAFAKKRMDADKLQATNDRLRSDWPDIASEIERVVVPAETLRRILQRIEGPTTAEDIALPTAFYRDAVIHAREIRDRFTFLDVAADAGYFDSGFLP